MVTAHPSATPAARKPPKRTLGALFAGSALMFSAATLQGGSLFMAEHRAEPIGEPVSEASEQAASSGQGTTAPLVATSRVDAWAPGTAPGPSALQRELPRRSTPEQEVPRSTAPAQTVPLDTSAVTVQPDRTENRLDGVENPDRGVLGNVLVYFTKEDRS